MKGEGRFSDDQCSPDQVWAWMVRSPHPHAKIVRIDKSAALKMPGVLGVFTGADCLAAGLKPINHSPVPATQDDVKLRGRGDTDVFVGRHHLLPADKARFVGEAVAMVVASTREEAFLASVAVDVEYELVLAAPAPAATVPASHLRRRNGTVNPATAVPPAARPATAPRPRWRWRARRACTCACGRRSRTGSGGSRGA